MKLKGILFCIGIMLVICGFLLALTSISITVYNYNNGNNEYLRFERTIMELAAQICIICGFIPIYYEIITNLKASGEI